MSVSTITQTAQYITFKLGDELFAINVAQVREVLDLTQITHVPTAPDYMRGVVNVRGSAIPVVDLRLQIRAAAGRRHGQHPHRRHGTGARWRSHRDRRHCR